MPNIYVCEYNIMYVYTYTRAVKSGAPDFIGRRSGLGVYTVSLPSVERPRIYVLFLD